MARAKVNATKATKGTVTLINTRKKLWDLTMSNVQNVGNKTFVFVPMELLYVDPRFQRAEDSSKAKINQLARNWDDNKLDPLKGSLHPEENFVSVIDGFHRVEAGKILNLPGLVVEVVKGLPENPEQRLIAEATIFATQTDDVSVLTPVQKHKANVLRGIKENVVIDELTTKYHIMLKKNPSHGRVQTGQLAGFSQALSIARTSGEDMLDTVLGILCKARWDMASAGLGSNALYMVWNILRLHPEYATEIADMLPAYLVKLDPHRLFAEAYSKYPSRKEKERILLHIEDAVCAELGLTRVYTGGSITTALREIA